MKKSTLLQILAGLYLVIFLTGTENACADLLKNGNFEKIADGMPCMWATDTYQSNEGGVWFYSNDLEPYSGTYHVTIESNKPNDAKLVQCVEVKPVTLYKFSCHVKAESVGTGAIGASISVLDVRAFSNDFKDTNGAWKYVEFYGLTGKEQHNICVAARLGGYGSLNTGKASFDDFRLEEVQVVPEGADVVRLYPGDDRLVKRKMTFSKVPTDLFYALLFIWLALLIYSMRSAIGRYRQNKKQSGIPLLEKPNPYKTLILIVFLIAIILRLGLCIANYDWNDYHFGVIKIILNEGRIPTIEDGGQCYHPKLYYLTAAAVLRVIPFDSEAIQIIASQLVNGVAGIFTIYIVWLFLKYRAVTDKAKFICFSLVALNPKLIGINAQISNDSFVILFVTAGIYFAYSFFNAPKPGYFLWLTLFSILAGLSKASGIILFFGLLLLFGIYLVLGPNKSAGSRKTYLVYLIIFILLFLLAVPVFGQYAHKYVKYGDPLAINAAKSPFPHFFKKTVHNRPGTTSIADSYLTFRFCDLMRYPTLENYVDIYPSHRTSLWSQLYARTHFLYYDMWPRAWQTNNALILNAGRAILILALLPSFVFLVSVVKRIYLWLKTVLMFKWNLMAKTNDWFFDIFLLGYVSSIVLFTLGYRDFCSMKAIYIFPALLPFLTLVLKETDHLYKSCEKQDCCVALFDSLFILLILLYVFTVVTLIWKLLGMPFVV